MAAGYGRMEWNLNKNSMKTQMHTQPKVLVARELVILTSLHTSCVKMNFKMTSTLYNRCKTFHFDYKF